MESVDHLLPGASRRLELIDQLAAFDPWRVSGVGESIIDECDALAFDRERESAYRARPIPDEVLADFRWDTLSDVRGAEQLLSTVPLRWRLDMASIIEDIINSD